MLYIPRIDTILSNGLYSINKLWIQDTANKIDRRPKSALGQIKYENISRHDEAE